MADARRTMPAKASIAMVAVLVGAGVLAGAVRAQGDPPHPVHVHSGSCDDLGDIVVPLDDVVAVAEGTLEGAGSAVPVMLSDTEVDLPLAAILAAPHAINVHESAENIGEYVACGDIGGRVIDGKLAIGLQEINGSDLSGVAVLEADDDDETDITIYLTEEGRTAGAEAPSAGAAPDAAPAAPTAEPAAAPDAAPAAPTAEPAAEPAAAAPAAQVAVDIRDFAYNPNPIEVAVGATITWTNQDGVPHTATATERDVLQSGLIPADGGSFGQAFPTAGEFSYFCEFHPDMNGTIIVR